jgi:hypothetical protein
MTRAKDISKIVSDANFGGTLDVVGKITADAGVDIDNINIDGTTIALSSGDLTLDVAGDIILDADGGDITLKDGGTGIGVIGNSGGATFYGGTASGIMFNGVNINPTNGTATRADNANDIGAASYRFKDLYLSGGAFIGGTGTANKLDDYEEGTFTHSFTNFSGTIDGGFNTGSYTKIGNTVHVHSAIVNASGTASGAVALAGLPFACLNASRGHSAVSYNGTLAGSVYGVSNIKPNQRIAPNSSTLETGVTSGTGDVNLVYSCTYSTN